MKKLLICFTIYFFIASNAPVEQIFSGSMNLVVQKRCSLKDKAIQEVMCLKGWWKSGLGGSITIND